MKNLEDEIEDLEQLDRRRIESAEMRDQGRDALRKVKSEWKTSPSMTDCACIIKALCDRKTGPLPEHVQRLEKLTTEEILTESMDGSEPIQIVRAAHSMQALAAAPNSAFSEALLIFYYQIVREIYTADAPDWQIGGVRADIGGTASAYVTGECVHAILGFARTLENTSTFVQEVRTLRKRKEQLEARAVAQSWCEVELARLRRDFYTSVVRLLDNIALKLDLPEDETRGWLLPLKPDGVDRFIDQVPERVARAVSKTAETFETVLEKLDTYRKGERRKARSKKRQRKTAPEKAIEGLRPSSTKKLYERSQTGHAIAFGALEMGLSRSKAAAAAVSSASNDGIDASLGKLAALFGSAARDVRNIIHPARTYLSTVLDRELAAASSGARPRWDPAEMIFAASSYGFAAGSFEDDRLRRVGICLSEELSERGRFRSGNPFHVDSEGGHFEVLGAEVLRAFAQLLENVETVPVDDALVKRMLLFFQDTRRSFRDTSPDVPGYYGWCPEQVKEPSVALVWVTAISVLALDRINRMLDARINAQVFRHFSVKQAKGRKNPTLRELFYPDYGLRHRANVPTGEHSWADEESVALTLEKMRTHVLGLSHREEPAPPFFSLILYGPPGTGKTTLVEALAQSGGVPLVEITPSDIVSSGVDVVERRARAVFKALSLLTRVVIIFDEFDPVLKRRKLDDRENTVFSFVTPGMLPKLKTLHEKAKKRSVAYILVTNLIGVLDGAAVRPGRFDRKLGIYPPDPVSREGRLLDELLALQAKFPEFLWCDAKVQEIVQRTPSAQMEALARKGWFRRPESLEPPKMSPFEYLTTDMDPREIPWPEAEPRLQPLPAEAATTEAEKAAEREYRQRAWLGEWEVQLTAGDLKEVIGAPPRRIPPVQREKTRSKKSAKRDATPASAEPGPPPS